MLALDLKELRFWIKINEIGDQFRLVSTGFSQGSSQEGLFEAWFVALVGAAGGCPCIQRLSPTPSVAMDFFFMVISLAIRRRKDVSMSETAIAGHASGHNRDLTSL